MRSLGMFACCSFLVACGGGSAADVTIVVTAPDGFEGDTVQLVIGATADDAGASITADGLPERKGIVAVAKLSTLSSPIAAGETVELSLDLGDLDGVDVVAALAGRGVSGPGGQPVVETPTATAFRYHVARLPGDDYTKYQLVLAPAKPATDAAGVANQVLLWGAADAAGSQRCVYLRDDADAFHPAQAAQIDTNRDGSVDGTDDDLLRGLFIVAHANDVDCDGFAEGDPLECSPDVYLDDAATTPDVDELDCLAQDDSNGSGPGACRVGGPACVDGVGDDPDACVPSRYCATTELCACKSAPDVPMCVRDLLDHSQGTLSGYYLDCTIHAPYVAADATAQLCTSAAEVALPIGTCESEILGATRTSAFSTELVWEGQHVSLSTTNEANGCILTITPGGELAIPMSAVTHAVRGAVLVAPLTNGSGLALPARFAFEPELDATCGNVDVYGTKCTLVGDQDSALAECLAAPPP